MPVVKTTKAKKEPIKKKADVEEEEKEEIKSKIMNELRWLLSEKTAGEIMKS